MPTLLTTSSHPQRVVYQPIILILNPCQRVGHLQSPNGATVHAGHLAPPIFALRNSFFEPLQFLCHDAESVDFRRERGVVEATNHSIGLLLAFRPQLERFELRSSIHRLPIVMKDRRGIQRLGVYFVAVVPQSYDNGVWVEYDLHILRLLNVALWTGDREGDESISAVGLKPRRGPFSFDAVAPLVQGEASSGGRIWGFVRVVRIFERPYEDVLSWVEILLASVTGGTTPRATRRWRASRRSASRAAIRALLLATALANCLSLHVEQTFRIAVCDALWFVKGDRQWDLSWTTVFRSPNVSIGLLHVCLVRGGCSHTVRV